MFWKLEILRNSAGREEINSEQADSLHWPAKMLKNLEVPRTPEDKGVGKV